MNSSEFIINRVEWHEGMLLSPQHFQQFSARLDSLVAWQSLAIAPFGWGIRKLEIDHGLLPSGLVRVLALDAIFPDGTVIQYSASCEDHGALDLPLSVCAEQLSQGSLDLYITLPVRSGRSGAQRYRSIGGSLVEDEVSEAEPILVPSLIPNLTLCAGAVPSALYSYLRLGSVFRENEVFKLGETLPPLLEVSPNLSLWKAVDALLSQLRGKAAFIAKQTAIPSSRVDDRVAQLELKDKLRSLLSHLPMAEAVLRTPHLHPLSLYWSLCALLGDLSLLRPGAIPLVPKSYNHGDLKSIFTPLLDALQEAVSDVSQDYRELKFEFSQGAFEIQLQPQWLVDKRLVVGLRGSSERDLSTWMGSAIVGTLSAFPLLRERRVLGAERRQVDGSDELGLRSGTGYLLYEIELNGGLPVPEDKLVIANANEGALSQRPQEMVLFVKG